MSDTGELREEAATIRRELIDLMTRLRALDLRSQGLAHEQNSLKAAVTLSLDHLDNLDARLALPKLP